jgi:hypothetical protein
MRVLFEGAGGQAVSVFDDPLQFLLPSPRFQGKMYDMRTDEERNADERMARRLKEAAELEEARKRLNQRLGIEEVDLSWLDEGRKPLGDR